MTTDNILQDFIRQSLGGSGQDSAASSDGALDDVRIQAQLQEVIQDLQNGNIDGAMLKFATLYGVMDNITQTLEQMPPRVLAEQQTFLNQFANAVNTINTQLRQAAEQRDIDLDAALQQAVIGTENSLQAARGQAQIDLSRQTHGWSAWVRSLVNGINTAILAFDHFVPGQISDDILNKAREYLAQEPEWIIGYESAENVADYVDVNGADQAGQYGVDERLIDAITDLDELRGSFEGIMSDLGREGGAIDEAYERIGGAPDGAAAERASNRATGANADDESTPGAASRVEPAPAFQ